MGTTSQRTLHCGVQLDVVRHGLVLPEPEPEPDPEPEPEVDVDQTCSSCESVSTPHAGRMLPRTRAPANACRFSFPFRMPFHIASVIPARRCRQDYVIRARLSAGRKRG